MPSKAAARTIIRERKTSAETNYAQRQCEVVQAGMRGHVLTGSQSRKRLGVLL
jgi:hypothetical protein